MDNGTTNPSALIVRIKMENQCKSTLYIFEHSIEAEKVQCITGILLNRVLHTDAF